MSLIDLALLGGDWRDQAACFGLDPELFFPMQGPTAGETVRQAKKVCWNDCPVRQECEDEVA